LLISVLEPNVAEGELKNPVIYSSGLIAFATSAPAPPARTAKSQALSETCARKMSVEPTLVREIGLAGEVLGNWHVLLKEPVTQASPPLLATTPRAMSAPGPPAETPPRTSPLPENAIAKISANPFDEIVTAPIVKLPEK